MSQSVIVFGFEESAIIFIILAVFAGYWLGYTARRADEKLNKKYEKSRLEKWIKKHAAKIKPLLGYIVIAIISILTFMLIGTLHLLYKVSEFLQ